jgi:hypothetical protein
MMHELLCGKEKCAWWIKSIDCCSIKRIAISFLGQEK